MARVIITIDDGTEEGGATISAETNWKPEDGDSPAVQMSASLLRLVKAVMESNRWMGDGVS